MASAAVWLLRAAFAPLAAESFAFLVPLLTAASSVSTHLCATLPAAELVPPVTLPAAVSAASPVQSPWEEWPKSAWG